MYATVPISNATDCRVPLGVKRFTHQVNRTLYRNRSLLPTDCQRRSDERLLFSPSERIVMLGAAGLDT
jgi:hypothetical protein